MEPKPIRLNYIQTGIERKWRTNISFIKKKGKEKNNKKWIYNNSIELQAC